LDPANPECNVEKIKSLKCAREVLERLDEQLGPLLLQRLREASHDTHAVSAEVIEQQVEVVSQALIVAHTSIGSGVHRHLTPESRLELHVIQSELQRLVQAWRSGLPEAQRAVLKEASLYVLNTHRTVRLIREKVQLEVLTAMDVPWGWSGAVADDTDGVSQNDEKHEQVSEEARRGHGAPLKVPFVVKRLVELRSKHLAWNKIRDRILEEFDYKYSVSSLKKYYKQRHKHLARI